MFHAHFVTLYDVVRHYLHVFNVPQYTHLCACFTAHVGFFIDRERPQMVRLYKVPSDFNVCRMRESFLRQFTEQAAASESGGAGGGGADELKELQWSGGGGVRMRSVTTLCEQRYRSSAVSAQRKRAVANVIRCVGSAGNVKPCFWFIYLLTLCSCTYWLKRDCGVCYMIRL